MMRLIAFFALMAMFVYGVYLICVGDTALGGLYVIVGLHDIVISEQGRVIDQRR